MNSRFIWCECIRVGFMKQRKQFKVKHVSGFIVYGLIMLSIGVGLLPAAQSSNGAALFSLALILIGGCMAMYGAYYFLDKVEWALDKYLHSSSDSAPYVEPQQDQQ